MPRVYLSLGSNIEPERHLKAALDALAAEFGALILSPVYESEAVGFTGENFYNLVVGIDAELTIGQLAERLRAIEYLNERRRSGEKFAPRTLDIDILVYGDQVGTVEGIELPRDEILKYAFVLRPLADIIPEQRHPVVGKCYRQLAAELDLGRQKLWPVPFDWRPPAMPDAATPDAVTPD
ncbi:MAG: 2-amino-4-hydroxy-6-hydroxymethyldihydropteridine diphosphokinase [Gammaproteobacteria bacterium]|nr:2-amino-4-hydroxy-6-hydroxymethyldihydropteridine diphosphokinase [Gammaproteobacteria bacterium]